MNNPKNDEGKEPIAYYKGRWFYDNDKFIEYVNLWPTLPLTFQSSAIICQELYRDIYITLDLNGYMLTNGEMQEVAEGILFNILEEFASIRKLKKEIE